MKVRLFVGLIWSLAVMIGLSTLMAFAWGYRINPTPSIPVGLWKLESERQTIRRGDVVSFCLENDYIIVLARQRGYLSSGGCPSGLEPLFKPVAAIAGDRVDVSAKGIAVNGVRILNSAALKHDASERPMPSLRLGAYQVAPDTVWLISSYSARSFDSRYFGPVSLQDMQGTLYPVWVRETP